MKEGSTCLVTAVRSYLVMNANVPLWNHYINHLDLHFNPHPLLTTMEHGAGADAFNHSSNPVNNQTGSNTAAAGTAIDGGAPSRDQDQYMPMTNISKIMRRVLPPHVKVTDDAKETIQECISEYISFITGEANERCHSERRKTISADDILWAMDKLGFDDYVATLTQFLYRYREAENGRIPRPNNVAVGPIGPNGPAGIPMGRGHADPRLMGGFLRTGSGEGGSSSSSSQIVGGVPPNCYPYLDKMNGK